METTSPDEISGRLKELVIPYGKEIEVIADTPVHYGLRIPKEFTLGSLHYQQSYYCWVFATPESVSFSLFHSVFSGNVCCSRCTSKKPEKWKPLLL